MRGLGRVFYNLNVSAEMLLKEKLPSQVEEFSAENCPSGSLAKVTKFHTSPFSFEACLPNPYKLSIQGGIRRAIILPLLPLNT